MPSSTSNIPCVIVRDTEPGEGMPNSERTWYWRAYRTEVGNVSSNWWTMKLDEACEFDSKAEATRKLREIRELVPTSKDQKLRVEAVA